jgi:hypothetical protein
LESNCSDEDGLYAAFSDSSLSIAKPDGTSYDYSITYRNKLSSGAASSDPIPYSYSDLHSFLSSIIESSSSLTLIVSACINEFAISLIISSSEIDSVFSETASSDYSECSKLFVRSMVLDSYCEFSEVSMRLGLLDSTSSLLGSSLI